MHHSKREAIVYLSSALRNCSSHDKICIAFRVCSKPLTRCTACPLVQAQQTYISIIDVLSSFVENLTWTCSPITYGWQLPRPSDLHTNSTVLHPNHNSTTPAAQRALRCSTKPPASITALPFTQTERAPPAACAAPSAGPQAPPCRWTMRAAPPQSLPPPAPQHRELPGSRQQRQ